METVVSTGLTSQEDSMDYEIQERIREMREQLSGIGEHL